MINSSSTYYVRDAHAALICRE